MPLIDTTPFKGLDSTKYIIDASATSDDAFNDFSSVAGGATVSSDRAMIGSPGGRFELNCLASASSAAYVTIPQRVGNNLDSLVGAEFLIQGARLQANRGVFKMEMHQVASPERTCGLVWDSSGIYMQNVSDTGFTTKEFFSTTATNFINKATIGFTVNFRTGIATGQWAGIPISIPVGTKGARQFRIWYSGATSGLSVFSFRRLSLRTWWNVPSYNDESPLQVVY